EGMVELLRETAEELNSKFQAPTSNEIEQPTSSFAKAAEDRSNAQRRREEICEVVPPKDELRRRWKEWEQRFIRYLTWKREMKVALAEDPIVDLHFKWQRFVAILNLYGDGFTCVI